MDTSNSLIVLGKEEILDAVRLHSRIFVVLRPAKHCPPSGYIIIPEMKFITVLPGSRESSVFYHTDYNGKFLKMGVQKLSDSSLLPVRYHRLIVDAGKIIASYFTGKCSSAIYVKSVYACSENICNLQKDCSTLKLVYMSTTRFECLHLRDRKTYGPVSDGQPYARNPVARR